MTRQTATVTYYRTLSASRGFTPPIKQSRMWVKSLRRGIHVSAPYTITSH